MSEGLCISLFAFRRTSSRVSDFANCTPPGMVNCTSAPASLLNTSSLSQSDGYCIDILWIELSYKEKPSIILVIIDALVFESEIFTRLSAEDKAYDLCI